MNASLRILLVCALLIHTVLCQNPKGLSSNVTTICSTSCTWDNPSIWSDGIVPADGDFVSLIQSGTYTIQITGTVTVGDFHFGVDDGTHDSGRQTFHVVSGASFTSTASYNAFLSTTVQVDANARFVVRNAGNTQGAFILAGYASFGGSSPSLKIGTRDAQTPLNIVYGSLEMHDGSTLVVTNGLTLSSTSTLRGSGNINGTVNCDGNLSPGLNNNAVGRFNIFGDLVLSSSSDTYMDVASITSFDQIVLSGNMVQNGDLYVNPLNKYVPLSHSIFYAFNYTGQRNGFDKVTEDCTITCLPGQNKWQIRVDQDWSALVYDSATSLLISFATISFCLFFTLL